MKNDNYKIVSDLIMKSMSDNTKEHEELRRMLTENHCLDDSVEKISSKEYFSDTVQMLNKAFAEREEKELLLKLKQRNLRQRKMRRRMVTLSSIAAAMIAISFYVFHLEEEVEVTKPTPFLAITKIDRPTLIIDNSDSIELNQETNQIIAQNYSKNGSTNSEEKTLSQRLIIPHGTTYTVVLEDGTEVQLNANSELIYPSKFEGDERRVELRGEGYFNVRKGDKPFIVQVNSSFVKVFGTSFNINAKDLHLVKTILVEGSVGVGCDELNMTLIQPNQMATIDTRNNAQSITEVNVGNHLAWKEGYFKFIDSDFCTMITELENWYGTTFHYNNELFKRVKVNFSISRTNSLERNIEFIETLFKIEIKEKGGAYIIEKRN